MRLHGLDILSMWMLFFSPSVCDSFCVSAFSLGQGSRSFCHELYEQSTVMFCESGRDACFEIVCILCADHVFVVSLVPLSRCQQLCLFPLLVCTQTYLEVCVVERIVARSVLSPEFFLLSASVCVASFFSNPCLQGWATICSFVYMGARDSCLRA